MTFTTASVRDAMSDQNTPSVAPAGDPWHAFGYIVSGVLLYGFLGWAADRWLGTSWLVGVGILAGAAMGVYMTWARFNGAHASTRADTATSGRTEPKTDTGDNR